MMKRSVPLALALSLLLLPVTLTRGFAGRPAEDAPPLPAFPGAEGYGALAKGGRGGHVIEVTNLNDSGPGSLRAAINASGPRTVVFRVGGTIALQSDLIVRGEDQAYLTIAGQTAPGGGILLRNYGLWIMDTHDVVVRYLRIRIGYQGAGGGPHGILVYDYQPPADTYHVVIDHSSISWILDDNGVWGPVRDVTLQWNIFAEASAKGRDGQYDCSNVSDGQGGCGLMWGPTDEVNHLTVHHNLLIHNYYRNPAFGGGEYQIINDVIYNPGWSATHLGQYGATYPIVVDFLGNYYKQGPDSRSTMREISFEEMHDASLVSLYARDNYGWNYDPQDPYAIVAPLDFTRRSAPLAPAPSVPVTVDDYETAKNEVLSRAGATLPVRDAVDVRLVQDFSNGTSSTPSTRGINPAFPVIADGTPPADSDHDGMPDDWERRQALNPGDPDDGSQDADGDGYTNVEEYLNELAGDQAPPTSGCSLFVATSGSDANDGRSEANSLQSIRRAAEIVQPGDVVCVKRGTYAGFGIVNKRGTPADPIVFRPYPGDEGQVIVDGKAPSWTVVVQFIEAEYVELQGFLITDSSRIVTKGIEICCNSTHLRIVANTIYDLHRANAVNGDGSFHEFLDNHIYGMEHGYGLYLSGSDTLISGNRIHDVDGYAMNLYPSCTRFVVENNVVYNNGRPDFDWNGTPRRLGDGILIYGSDNIVQNNVSYGNMDWGIRVRGARVVNNTVYGNGLQGIYAYDNTGSIIRNNLSYANRGEEGYPGQAYVGAGNVADHNSWNLDLGDPQFADPVRGDFHLLPSSPAIDAGSLEGAPAQDFEGDPRPQGAGVDLGADEVAAGGPSFADVPASHWAYADIEKLYQGGYVVGCLATPVRKYCPEQGLTRAEAAVFVTRGHHTASFLPPEPNPSDLHFADVAYGTWYAKWIEQLWQDGFTSGCATGPLRFCPEVPHTRAESTVFFLRMLRGKDYVPGEPASLPYTDVAPGTWYRKWVAASHDAGLTRDCEDPPNRSDDRFRPEEAITRAEAACMMAKAKDASP